VSFKGELTNRFRSHTDIDRIIHEPGRLMIIAHLYVVAEADFVFLKSRTGLTRGNLSSHLRKLEEAGYLSINKEFVDRIPRTVLQITDKGRVAFETYRRVMKTVMDESQKRQRDNRFRS
jgi:DNA-binding MarR family transcriptional regulator